jgi:predicted transcriptional regulator
MKYEESIVEALRMNKAMTMKDIGAMFPQVPVLDKSNMVRRLRNQGRITAEQVIPTEGRPYLVYKAV